MKNVLNGPITVRETKMVVKISFFKRHQTKMIL